MDGGKLRLVLLTTLSVAALGVALYLTTPSAPARQKKPPRRRKRPKQPPPTQAKPSPSDFLLGALSEPAMLAADRALWDAQQAKTKQQYMAQQARHAAAQTAADQQANAALMHQLADNPSFALTPRKTSEIEQHVTNVVKRAFWDDFGRRIAAGDFEQAVALLEEVRERLLKLLADSVRVAASMGLRAAPAKTEARVAGLCEALGADRLRQALFPGTAGGVDGAAVCDILEYILEQLAQLGSADGDAALTAFRREHLEPRVRGAADAAAFTAALPACFEFIHAALDRLGTHPHYCCNS